jgi:hypothetical protein
MKIVEKIDTQKKVDELTGEEKDSLFTKLLTGKDVTETVKTSRGEFVVKYPLNNDTLAIGRIMIFRRGGIDPQAFDAVTERIIHVSSTLDVIVVSGPDWYEKAKKNNEKFTFLEVPDEQFNEELYQKAHSFCDEVRKQLDEEKESADKRVPSPEGDDETVGLESFEGLSSERGDTGT